MCVCCIALRCVASGCNNNNNNTTSSCRRSCSHTLAQLHRQALFNFSLALHLVGKVISARSSSYCCCCRCCILQWAVKLKVLAKPVYSGENKQHLERFSKYLCLALPICLSRSLPFSFAQLCQFGALKLNFLQLM